MAYCLAGTMGGDGSVGFGWQLLREYRGRADVVANAPFRQGLSATPRTSFVQPRNTINGVSHAQRPTFPVVLNGRRSARLPPLRRRWISARCNSPRRTSSRSGSLGSAEKVGSDDIYRVTPGEPS